MPSDGHGHARSLRTILVVAAREMHDHAKSPVIWMLVLIASALGGFSARAGVSQLEMRVSWYEQLAAQRDLRVEAQPQLTGWQIEPGLRAIRRPNHHALLVQGTEPILPQYWDFSPSGTRQGPALPEVRVGSFAAGVDAEFIFRIILGLLAIVIAAETVAGERASGTLLALLGQPVSPSLVLAGKYLGAAGTLTVSIAAVLLASTMTIALSRPEFLRPDFLVTAGILGALALLYLLACFAGGVLVASAISAYRPAITSAIVFWCLASSVALPAADVIAQTMSPTAPFRLVEEEKERVLQDATRTIQIDMGDRYVRELGTVQEQTERPPATAAVNANRLALGSMWDEHARRTRAALAGVQSRVEAPARRQSKIRDGLTLISPASQFTAAAMSIAGTGAYAGQVWSEAIAAYQRTLDRELFDERPRLTFVAPARAGERTVGAGSTVIGFNRRPLPTLATLPAFTAPERSLWWRLADSAALIAVLVAYAAGLAAAALWSFRRLEF